MGQPAPRKSSQSYAYAKIAQGERNKACFNCRAAANLMQRYVFIAKSIT